MGPWRSPHSCHSTLLGCSWADLQHWGTRAHLDLGYTGSSPAPSQCSGSARCLEAVCLQSHYHPQRVAHASSVDCFCAPAKPEILPAGKTAPPSSSPRGTEQPQPLARTWPRSWWRRGEQWALARSLWYLNSKLFYHRITFLYLGKVPPRGAFYYPGLLNRNFLIMRRWDLRCCCRSGSPAAGDLLLLLPVYQPLPPRCYRDGLPLPLPSRCGSVGLPGPRIIEDKLLLWISPLREHLLEQ